MTGLRQSGTGILRRAFLGALFMLAMATSVRAEDEANEVPGHNEANEHEYALDRVKDGSALPLADILVEVQKTVPGDLLEAQLKMRNSVLVYVLTMLSKTGIYSIVTVNAKDNTIINVQEN